MDKSKKDMFMNQKTICLSEKDPLSLSGMTGSKICKAMLEKQILKGFQCCKCADETEGEFTSTFEGSSLNESIPEKVYDANEVSRNSPVHSQSFLESGIKVTDRDLNSSTATHVNHRPVYHGDFNGVTSTVDCSGDDKVNLKNKNSVKTTEASTLDIIQHDTIEERVDVEKNLSHFPLLSTSVNNVIQSDDLQQPHDVVLRSPDEILDSYEVSHDNIHIDNRNIDGFSNDCDLQDHENRLDTNQMCLKPVYNYGKSSEGFRSCVNIVETKSNVKDAGHIDYCKVKS